MKTVKLLKMTDAVWRYVGIRLAIAAVCLFPLVAGLSVMLCGRYEAAQGSLVPRYLWDDDELIRKHMFTLAPSLHFLADRYGASEFENMSSFRDCSRVLSVLAAHVQRNSLDLRGRMAATRDLNDYKNQLDPAMLVVSERVVDDLFVPFLNRKYSSMAEELLTSINSSNDMPDWLIEMYPDEAKRMRVLDSLGTVAMALMNHDLGGAYARYEDVPVPAQVILREPRWISPGSQEWELWGDFVRGLPGQYKWLPTLDVRWRSYLRANYNGDVERLNRAWKTEYSAFSLISAPAESSGNAALESDWSKFVLREWPRSMLELPAGYDAVWREYLQSRKAGSGAMLDDILHDNDNDAKRAIELPLRRPNDAGMDILWCDFVESGAIPAREMTLLRHEKEFGPYLRSNYLGGRVVSLNEEWHTSFEKFADVPLPLGLSDLSLFLDDADVLRREYASEAWFTALRSLAYPPGIVMRTLGTVAGLVLISLFLSAVTAYLLARCGLRGSLSVAGICLAGALVPPACYLGSVGASPLDLLQAAHLLAVALVGLNLMSVMIFRSWFLRLIMKYREVAAMDGAGEFRFVVSFVLRYSWQIVVYMAVVHFFFVYCFLDWQVLLMGRLWDWTLAVWALDQGAGNPSVKAAVALLGLMPAFFLVAISYPILSRYCLVPVLRITRHH